MVFKGSRYTQVEVIQPPAPDGRAPRALAARPVAPTPGRLEHVAAEGERLDQLAARYYSEPTKYWLILDANPDVLNPFELLEPGRIVYIPQNRIVRT